jgi:hypothetical protein
MKINNKGVSSLVLLVALVGIVILAGGTSLFSMYLPSGLVLRPDWGYVSCEPPLSSPITIQNIDIPKTGLSIFCGKDVYVKDCNIVLSSENSALFNSMFVKKCRIDSSYNEISCESLTIQDRQQFWSGTITPEYKIYVGTGAWLPDPIIAHAQVTYTKYILASHTGRYDVLSSTGCNINFVSSSKIPVSINGATIDEGKGCMSNFGVGDWCNYVAGWNVGISDGSIFKHTQYGYVYCTGGKIYDLVNLTLADGSIKVLDPTYSVTTNGGDRITGLGKYLGVVECCPSMSNCGTDFKWHYDVVNKTCFSDAQCDNGGIPYPVSSKIIGQKTCVSGNCSYKERTVGCTYDSDCSSGKICDRNTWTCKTGDSTPFCGDGKCLGAESKDNCTLDCGLQKAWYQDMLDNAWIIVVIGSMFLIFSVYNRRK